MKLKLTRSSAVIATSLFISSFSITSASSEAVILWGEKEGDYLQALGNFRVRYEFAEIDGLAKSTVGSLRSRIGLKAQSSKGFSVLVEGENTAILTDENKYRPFPVSTTPNRAVIADPKSVELNRLQLGYSSEAIGSSVIVGRQALLYNDQRFVGDVGWRQNNQTYDAVKFENHSLKGMKFNYAYISKVNRIFGGQTPLRVLKELDSNSHVIDLEYSGSKELKVRLFSYLLDFDNAAGASSNSYGVELTGSKESSIGELSYSWTGAMQTDAANNPSNYEEFFLRASLGVNAGTYQYGIGSEMMTGNGSNSFKFPLGTNHKFSGFADAFLNTPANGLIDNYGWVSTKLLGLKHRVIVHSFRSENVSSNLGLEVDYVASKKFSPNILTLFKLAALNGDNSQADTLRASLETNFTF